MPVHWVLILHVNFIQPGPNSSRHFSASVALDLIDRMLAWRPEDRVTVEEALRHPFLALYHNPEEEIGCVPFDHSFENQISDVETLKRQLFAELSSQHPPADTFPSLSGNPHAPEITQAPQGPILDHRSDPLLAGK